MNNTEKIENIIAKKGGVIKREELLEKEIPASTFSAYSKKRGLIKVAPGVYGVSSFVPDDMYLLQQRYPKAIYYGMSALYLLQLTDVAPEYLEVIAPSGYRIRKKCLSEEIVIHHESKAELYEFGNVEALTIFGNKVVCCGAEKAVVEMVRRRQDYDSEVFVKALRRYWKSKKKDLKLLEEYAAKRNLTQKVHDTLEVIANEDQ